jgi:type IV secretion system protein VirB1
MMDLPSLIAACGLVLSPSIVGGIVDTESARKPYRINVNSKTMKVVSYSFNTENEAVSFSKDLISQGYSIDMGIGQINSINLPSVNLTVEDIFKPCPNLIALQTIFLRGYNLKVDRNLSAAQKEFAALSRYNTGHPRYGIKNGYVKKVISAKLKIEGKNTTAPLITLSTQLTLGKPQDPEQIEGIPDGFSTTSSSEGNAPDAFSKLLTEN